MASGGVEDWLRTELHDVVGYSDKTLSQFILSLANKATSASALHGQLLASGIDEGPRVRPFAEALFQRIVQTQGKGGTLHSRAEGFGRAGAASSMRGRQPTNADLIRQSQQYTLVESDDEDYAVALGGGKDAKSVSGSSKPLKKDKKEKNERNGRHLRKKSCAGGDEEEEEDIYAVRKRLRDVTSSAAAKTSQNRIGEELKESGQKQKQLDEDIRERDEFVQRMLEKEDQKTKRKAPGGGLTAQQIRELATTGAVSKDVEDYLDDARKVSRREYLKKREEKELALIEKELRDEEFLFGDIEITAEEKQQREVKRKVLEIAKEKDRFDTEHRGYRMPEAYETEDGKLDTKKREAALMARYQEEEQYKTEQELWEEQQVGVASFRPGAKDKGAGKLLSAEEAELEEFLFENQIDFVSDQLLKNKLVGEKKKQEKRKNLRGFEEAETSSTEASSSEEKEEGEGWEARAGKPLTELEKLKAGRKKLPVFKYREEILAAIKDHQVLVLSAETGSGKTTQIPQYLHEVGYTQTGMVACTQPRRVAAMSVAARVSQEMGTKIGQEVGYSIRFENCTSEKTAIKYMTDGMLLREFLTEPDMASYSVVIIDEAHERTLHTDVLLGLCKDISRFREDLRLIISSATLNAERFSNYFDGAAIFTVPGRMFSVDVYYTKAPEADYLDAAVVSVLHIHISQPVPGDILVFLTGQEEIETAAEELTKRTKGLGSRIKELIICPIYATLPSEQQAKIFEKAPPNARKVVLATNIAETSLTIDGICYVVDTGFCKQKSYNPRSGMESLIVTPVSRAAAEQRKGRAGRTQDGKCFRLYTMWAFQNELDEDTVPEIQRTNMGNVVLMLMSLGINNILQFDFMDKPPTEAIMQALQQLYALAAINERGELTKLGRRMAEFPLEPMHSKALLASEKYKCADDVITILAMLTVGNSIFYRPKDRAVHADNARFNFARGGGGDHLALLRCYQQWEESNFSTQWCYENFVQVRSMKKARDIREQLAGLCERVEIEAVSSADIDDIRKAITAGFFFNCARLTRSQDYQTLKHTHTVYIHPSSVLARDQREGVLHSHLVYHELAFTSKEYMRSITPIQPKWLLEVAQHYYDAASIEDLSHKKKAPKATGKAPEPDR